MPDYLGIMLAAGRQGLLAIVTGPAALIEAEVERVADLELLDYVIREELREENELLLFVFDLSRDSVFEEVAVRDIPQIQFPLWQQLNQPSFGPPRVRRANGPVRHHHGKRPLWRR